MRKQSGVALVPAALLRAAALEGLCFPAAEGGGAADSPHQRPGEMRTPKEVPRRRKHQLQTLWLKKGL